ncbi:TPA: bacteriocin immunity protein [Enterococcus faecium]
MSKSEEIENMVLKLYDLVLNPEINEKERILLIEAKIGLEKGQYYPKVMNNLERSLRPLAIKGELSKPVSPFYMEISTIGKFEKELGRGMASAPITFGHL